jgi:CheY-like chemotaxis protein
MWLQQGDSMDIGRALIVDDSKVVQFKLKRMLEARGLGVDTASSGHEALDFLKSHSPDLIFMDFMMPDMDGYEVTGMITADPQTSAIPVVMCTGHDTPQDRARAKENGASGFVTKPVDDAALDGLLAELNGRPGGTARGASRV